MGHLNMRRQGLQSTRKKNVVLCTTLYQSTTKEENIYSNLCGRLQITTNKGNKYLYVMYIYDYNAILTAALKNRRDK